MNLVWVVIPLVLIGIIGMQEVSACSCAMSTIEEAFENTEVVFSGLATNIIHVDGIYHTNFLVTDKWKNIEQDIIQINIYSNDGTCGVNFKINKKYIIFAGEYSGDDPKKSGLYTSACTYTQSVEHAGINTLNFLENNSIFFQSVMPPLKQISTGIHVKDVTCKEGLDLIFESSDNSPACVRPQTAEKLIQRGWTNKDVIDSGSEPLIRGAPSQQVRIIDLDGNFLNNAIVNSSSFITVDVANPKSTDQQYLIIFEIQNEEKILVEQISEIVTVKSGESFTPKFEWIPKEKGRHLITNFFLDASDNSTAIWPPYSTTMLVK